MADQTTLSLEQRRQLDAAIKALATAQSDLELTNAARKIVHQFPSTQVLTVLIKHLETSNSQLRGGLAHVAALLPPEEAAPALRRYAANRQNVPQGRFTAATILERYLGESLSPGLLNDLQNNDDAAFDSLREAVNEAKQNRYVLFEYVTQMHDHPEEIAFAVMDALARLPEADRPELLRLLAQDERKIVAQSALGRLEQLAASGENRGAVRALAILQHVLPATMTEGIERSLRKLQMRGKGYHPPAFDGWRTLVSLAEPNGSLSIWLINQAERTETNGAPAIATLVSCAISLRNGIVGLYFSEQVDPHWIPKRHLIGEQVVVEMESGAALFVEAPIAYGLWLMQSALRLTHDNIAQAPLTPDYQLYNDLIWQFDRVQPPAELQRYFLPADEAPTLAPDSLEADVDELFDHPALARWTFVSLPSADSAKLFGRPLSPIQLASLILSEIAQVPERTQLMSALEDGLRAQAAWLHLSGDEARAACAYRLAQVTPLLLVTENPLIRRMVERGLAG